MITSGPIKALSGSTKAAQSHAIQSQLAAEFSQGTVVRKGSKMENDSNKSLKI